MLATGSYPFVPPIPGRDRKALLRLSHHRGPGRIREASRDARRGVVIGGGLLGLEAAKALHDLGLETHVVEFAPRLMAVQVDEGGGRVLRRHIESLGVRVHCGKSTTAIEAGEQHRHVLRFADGESVETDIVVFSAGIRPQDALATACGTGGRAARRHRHRRPVPHQRCRDIYAIGECALWQGKMYRPGGAGLPDGRSGRGERCVGMRTGSSPAPT